MAYLVFFSRSEDFDAAFNLFSSSSRYLEVIEAPLFCRGLACSPILLSGSRDDLLSELERGDIPFCGLVRHQRRTTGGLDGGAPRQVWKTILGDLTLKSIGQSVSDPTRLHIEIETRNEFQSLIPLMAALIRGGSYSPESLSLALEEGHRLIVFSRKTIVISRADDVYDFWINLRCSVDLICDAFEKRDSIKPVDEARQGIGAIEIFRRLPATNCGHCGIATCMEFAVALFTGKAQLAHCKPLLDQSMFQRRQSLVWLLDALGIE